MEKKAQFAYRDLADKAVSPGFPGLIKLAEPFERFFKEAVSGSYPLFLTAILALIWANLSSISYNTFWHTELSLFFGDFQVKKSLIHWIDEALMALFFFIVGLEIKR